ncbi:hypothetical protein KI809_17615 [Geobacter pelophilus]|uniref:PBP domain-containing protein n=1 Tax=Geoanaerobacter pelophilus TaxID=60036 RepID=A0AAW4L9A8_9BACT|nr:hypothetical protein [Geoanaerobacter pelophilus]MBT0666132.1 hypothetical protein [Geoanaerobacter pelophilus]
MKITVKTLATAAAVLALAGVANAATVEINGYGASAQYPYWKAMTKKFLEDVAGCSKIAPNDVKTAVTSDDKHFIAEGKSCTAYGNDNITIRYSGIASAESVRSLMGTTNPDSCPTAYQRKVAGSVAAPNTKVCKTIDFGASDVAGDSFGQTTKGATLGPMGTDYVTFTANAEDTSALTPANPLVVPFAFFVNKAVTKSVCNAGSPVNAGNYCQVETDCGGTIGTTTYCDGSTQKTIDNITRVQAVNLFNGTVNNWADFGANYASKPVVTCMRHAGSGTQAAFEKTVMSGGNAWGGNIPVDQVAGRTYFGKSSGDLIKCVNGNSVASPNGNATVAAIGFADADQPLGVANTSQNVVRINYNGVAPSRINIRNGIYDYWTTQWIYQVAGSEKPIVNDMITFASDPANIPADKAGMWASAAEMKFNKFTDGEFIGFYGAATEVLP